MSRLVKSGPVYKRTVGKLPEGPVYHYTSLQGLGGILRSGKIRATNIRYFTDASEFDHAFESASKFVKAHESKATKDKAEFIRAVKEKLLPENLAALRFKEYFFVACFSEKPNKLDLWHAYCPPEAGYCLGFDLNVLNGVNVGQCIYKDEIKKELIEEQLWMFFELSEDKIQAFDQKYPSIINPDDTLPQKRAAHFVFDLMHYAALFKDYAFHSEQEWRAVEYVFREPSRMNYRCGTSLLVPYVKIELFEGEKLTIADIWAGPTRHPDLAVESVHGFVRSLNAEQERPFQISILDKGVPKSKIPFRTSL